jgi:hypothetical protein
MKPVTAPPGRLYHFGAKASPNTVVENCRDYYRRSEQREATWMRCHPDQEQLFAALWPGALPDPRVQRGTVMLGVDS